MASKWYLNKIIEKLVNVLSGPLTLDKAILIALAAHGGQKDKGKNSYIRHVLRVMEGMDSEDEMCVAVLHDTVEDSDISLDDLKWFGFTESQLNAIDALTKKKDDDYMDNIINKVMLSTVATKVKIKDIRDNMQLWRLKSKKLTEKDTARMQNYIDALTILEGGIKR